MCNIYCSLGSTTAKFVLELGHWEIGNQVKSLGFTGTEI